MEKLLACAREHLEFSRWYLREKGVIQVGDNGLFWITALGVDKCNESDVAQPMEDRLLTAAEEPTNGDAASSRPSRPGTQSASPPAPAQADVKRRAVEQALRLGSRLPPAPSR